MSNSTRNTLSFLKRTPRKVRMYDAEKHELIKEFETLNAAASYAGVSTYCVSSAIRDKSRCYKNKLGKVLAFR